MNIKKYLKYNKFLIIIFLNLFLSCSIFDNENKSYRIRYEVECDQDFEVIYYDYELEREVSTAIIENGGKWTIEFTNHNTEYEFTAKKLSVGSFGTISGKIFVDDEEKKFQEDSGDNVLFIKLKLIL